MDIALSTSSAFDADVDLLVVGATSLDGLAELDARFGGALRPWLEGASWKPEAGSTRLVPGLGKVAARQVVVMGLGDGDRDAVAKAAAKAGSLARDEKARTVALAVGSLDAATFGHAVEFLHVGTYRFDTYLPEDRRSPAVSTVTFHGIEGGDAHQAALARAAVRAKYQAMARDLVNLPAADIHPASLAERAASLAALPGVEVEVWDIDKCKAEGLVGIEAVGRGSVIPGRLVHLTWHPEGAKDHIALVGKGVTFDAGGLSIKPTAGMQTMRCDMGGAATTIAAFGAIAELGLPVAVDAFVPTVENLIDGASFKLGDILRYRNGVTVEIHNTDAEGRLILADALCLASEIDEVTTIVDMATLTGAVIVAIGQDFTGLFTDDDDLADAIQTAGDRAGEAFWRMPLHKPYNRLLKGTWGQIKNVGSREAGSVTAALYLQHFVGEGKRWAHLDIAGTAFIDNAAEPYAKGGSGQVVRTLVDWVEDLAEG